MEYASLFLGRLRRHPSSPQGPPHPANFKKNPSVSYILGRRAPLQAIGYALPHQYDGEVLRDAVVVHKVHDHVHLKLDTGRGQDGRGAREHAREQHVDGDLHVAGHVAVADLKVLDLRDLPRPRLAVLCPAECTFTSNEKFYRSYY